MAASMRSGRSTTQSSAGGGGPRNTTTEDEEERKKKVSLKHVVKVNLAKNLAQSHLMDLILIRSMTTVEIVKKNVLLLKK